MADLEEQEALCLKIQDLAGRANATADRLREERAQLAKILKTGGRTAREIQKIDDGLAELLEQMETARGRYQEPKLLNQISYLGSMLNRADQKPGRDAYIRYDELNAQLAECEAALKKLLEGR